MDRLVALVRERRSLTQWKRSTSQGAKSFTKYKQDGNPTDLSEAIANLQNSLAFCPPGNPNRLISLATLTLTTSTRYDRQGEVNDLNLAIQYQQEWLDLLPVRSPNQLDTLAHSIMVRYKRDGDLADLTLAIQCQEEALNLRPPGYPQRISSLNNLADAFRTRYQRERKLGDLARAIQYYQDALDLCPLGHPDRSNSLNNLAATIHIRYNQEGDLGDLTRAIKHYREALDLRPPGHPDRSGSLYNLASAILGRYKLEGDLADLALAIQYQEEALDLRSPGSPPRSHSLGNLANAILARYQVEGNLADLARAMQCYHEAVELEPPGHPARPMSLYNLANTMKLRYEREGNLDDLTRSIQHYNEALDICPPGHPDRHRSLNNLAHAIWIRYQREGDLDDLTRTVQYHEEALAICPARHPERLGLLNNLANVIQTRYKREGNLADLTLAIQYHEEALDLHHPGNPGRSASLNNLANAIRNRYDREGMLDDLTRAIQLYQEALDLCPLGHPHRSGCLNNLAIATRTRYKRERNSDDLTRTLQYYEEALDLRPPGHPDRSSSLLNVAETLYAQYYQIQSLENSVNSDSVDPTADTAERLEVVDRPSSEYDLRDSLRLRMASLLQEASQSAGCSPRDCLKAAFVWVRISKDLAPQSTLEAYTLALDRLDVALAVGQSLNQRHIRLLSDEVFGKTKDLGIAAATWALQHGNLERAIELLEQGRSLLFAQIGRYRVELDELQLTKPALADRFAHLSQLLDTSTVSNQKVEETVSTINDPYERYRKVSTEWARTVDEIRNLDGFETFLKPPSYDQLRQAAAEGPVIMLIPHQEGSTALIIRNDAPIHRVDLPLATSDRLEELSKNFTRALKYKDYTEAQRARDCAGYLASLWNEVAGPIAQALQHDLDIPLRSRVWWCPTSVACFLPLHAAGLYSKEKPGENFPNKYISSFTPTLQALRRAQQTNSTTPKKLLVISQPETPGEPPLPDARVEADTIAKIVPLTGTELPLTMTPLLSEAGTCKAVQREMASHPWIHFICHGVQKASQPLDSYLSLYDGPLILREIIEQKLPNADFAFLAACHSAAGDKDLANESLHLAAAMQFAGFRGVVGTLWKMRDTDGPPLAEAFYKDMIKHGDHRRAAVALSKAITHLRRNKVPIHRWMRFIHIGA